MRQLGQQAAAAAADARRRLCQPRAKAAERVASGGRGAGWRREARAVCEDLLLKQRAALDCMSTCGALLLPRCIRGTTSCHVESLGGGRWHKAGSLRACKLLYLKSIQKWAGYVQAHHQQVVAL